jgi:2,3-bisphosphoglycerate-independent phosphoglycerate mutase
MDFDILKRLSRPADAKVVLMVMDGLGGLPEKDKHKTELETADTPNLDRLAADGICGLHVPVGPGMTPGSGPAHLALFGYDPVQYQVGRGTLAALGIGFGLKPGDVAARGNFCSIDNNGKVTDRRAGRIPTETCRKLCEKLREIRIEGAEVFVEPVKDYRFLLVLRGDGLSPDLADTDPQKTGKPPLDPKPLSEAAKKTAGLVAEFADKAKSILKEDPPANMVLLRGFSDKPDWPLFPETYGLKAAAIAGYPMYRGVSRLVGMDVLETGETLDDQVETLRQHWNDYDFFYFHVKKIDSAGEDGDFDRKVSLIEDADRNVVPKIMDLNPGVMVVTGDHSTPATMAFHSWHPVPVLIWSEKCRKDPVKMFGERACIVGGLGPRIPAVDLMPIAMANAGRIEKFGA